MDKKIIYSIDVLIVGASLILLLGAIGYTRPMIIAPLDNFTTSNNFVLFSVENANLILIDDNPDFTSPDEISVRDNAEINLKPGFYYWKIKSMGKSEVRTLNILSEINLKLKQSDEGYDVINAGNTNLNVDVYNNETKIGSFDLGVFEKENSAGNKFIGSKDG